jgi:LuxR family maltose regulon positive regulatory protein
MVAIADSLEFLPSDRSAVSSTTAVPSVPAWWVDRPRLTAKVATEGKRLTVVTGSPGAGKTTLLADWARQRTPQRTSWWSLHASDNDPARFWDRWHSTLAAVADHTAPEAGSSGAGAAPGFVVILDRCEVLDNGELLDGLASTLRRLPPEVAVVIGSRSLPHLGLHRLRVSGELVEIGEDDLRFTADEAKQLLSLAGGTDISADQATLIAQQTEGWAMGLHLAAGAVATGDETLSLLDRFNGDFGPVADYFAREVLDPLPEEDVRFLVDTSILERLGEDVCERVTDRRDPEPILGRLAARHLFVIPDRTASRGYRHHILFADFLRRRLLSIDPQRYERLRIRAADRLCELDDIPAALRQLAAVDRRDEAFAMAATDVARRLSEGVPHRRPLLPGGVPEAYLERDPRHIYLAALSLLCAGKSSEGATWLRRLEQATASEPSSGPWPVRTEFLWVVHDTMRADPAGVLRHGRQAQERLLRRDRSKALKDETAGSTTAWMAAIDDAIIGLLTTFPARAHLWAGDLEAARTALAGGAPPDHQYQDPVGLGVLALLACHEGRLRDALHLGHIALERASRFGEPRSLTTLDSYLAVAAVLRERHDLEGASRLLAGALGGDDAESTPLRFWSAPLESELIRVMVAQGRASEALGRIRGMRTGALPTRGRRLFSQLDALECRCWYLLGDGRRAQLTLASIPPGDRRPELLASADLQANRPDLALARLLAGRDEALAAGAELRRLTLLARTRVQLGQEREALATLGAAVDMGRAEGYVTAFVEQASDLLPLLQRIAGRFPDAYLSRLVAHGEAATTTPPLGLPYATLQQLSAREREILAHLPSHRSQREIAAEMYVSLNTVKTHIRAVYRKLGVRSRSDAVRLARAQKLLG